MECGEESGIKLWVMPHLGSGLGLGLGSITKVFYFLNFILRILCILTMHECSACSKGCVGIFKNKKYLNSTLLL